MSTGGRVGRPKASSRETLAEAACELFFENGFDATSIRDITSRAGVSRSSFFNYFASKSDILWAGLDERIAVFEYAMASASPSGAADGLRSAVMAIVEGLEPDSLALSIVHAAPMRLEAELERETAVRAARVSRAVAARLRRGGVDRLAAEVSGAAWGGAVMAAIDAWARAGAGRVSLEHFASRAADLAERVHAGG